MPLDYTEHLAGRMKHVLQGRERGLAHEAIRKAFLCQDHEKLTTLAHADSSLFIEEIPRCSPFHRGEDDAWDRMWQKHTRWLDRAAASEGRPCVGAVQAVVKAGVHPDDRRMFVSDALLGFPHWRNDPKLLRFALEYGASPDLPPERDGEGNRTVIRRVVHELSNQMNRAGLDSHKGYVAGLFECANMLLDAGAQCIDIVESPRPHPFCLGISLLGDHWHEAGAPWAVEPLTRLVRRLHEAGGAIDGPAGYEQLPLVVFVLRQRNLTLARLLVDMGANVEDAHICRSKGRDLCAVLGVIEEAQRAMGPEAAAEMTAAIMKRRMTAPAANEPAAARAVRRTRAV